MTNESSKTFRVSLEGLTPILFDRYSGSNKEELAAEKKIYTSADGKYLVLPALNISSFLSAQNTESAPQRICGKQWKQVARSALSFVTISPILVPFLANGKPIPIDSKQLHIVEHVARLAKGIPNPKTRPQLDLPWGLDFEAMLFENPDLHEDLLEKLFRAGGIQIGFGTWRGLFGKFKVVKWEEI